MRKAAIPILPVPGSLRVSPDGRSVAWIEVSAPARLVPVMTSLDRDEEAREIAFLSTGRPLRDRELAHVVSSLSGFSKDGQRLGLVIEAWNDTPGPGAALLRRLRRDGRAPVRDLGRHEGLPAAASLNGNATERKSAMRRFTRVVLAIAALAVGAGSIQLRAQSQDPEPPPAVTPEPVEQVIVAPADEPAAPATGRRKKRPLRRP